MTTTDTDDVEGTIEQIERVPLVADIHFTHRLAHRAVLASMIQPC